MGDELKIEALVWVNKKKGLVLNRSLKFLYEFDGKDLIGRDGPFADYLRYEKSDQAFAGRKFSIPLKDGGAVQASGQYWQSHMPGTVPVAYQTKEGLKRCYVFYGGATCQPDDLNELIAKYTGPTYDYQDYKKLIQYDVLRNQMWQLRRQNDHIIKQLNFYQKSFSEVLCDTNYMSEGLLKSLIKKARAGEFSKDQAPTPKESK